jgi:hypothetical protein
VNISKPLSPLLHVRLRVLGDRAEVSAHRSSQQYFGKELFWADKSVELYAVVFLFGALGLKPSGTLYVVGQIKT